MPRAHAGTGCDLSASIQAHARCMCSAGPRVRWPEAWHAFGVTLEWEEVSALLSLLAQWRAAYTETKAPLAGVRGSMRRSGRWRVRYCLGGEVGRQEIAGAARGEVEWARLGASREMAEQTSSTRFLAPKPV